MRLSRFFNIDYQRRYKQAKMANFNILPLIIIIYAHVVVLVPRNNYWRLISFSSFICYWWEGKETIYLIAQPNAFASKAPYHFFKLQLHHHEMESCTTSFSQETSFHVLFLLLHCSFEALTTSSLVSKRYSWQLTWEAERMICFSKHWCCR